MGGAAPRSAVRVSTGPRGAPPPSGSADDGAQLPVPGVTRDGVRAMENRDADERRSGVVRLPVVKGLPGSSICGAQPRIVLRQRNRAAERFWAEERVERHG